MPKILFIAIHRPFRSPSQRFRFDQFMDFFNNNGYTITYSSLINESEDRWFYKPGHWIKKTILILKSILLRFHTVFTAKQYDIIFVQREAIMLGTSFFERQLAKRAPLIFDFDDSIWQLDVSDANKKFSWLKNPEKTSEIISVASVVLAGNDYLANYAKKFNSNTSIVPTTLYTHGIDYEYTKKLNNKKITIGWIGSTTTIKHIEWALPMLNELFSIFDNQLQLIIISDKKPYLPSIHFTFIQWTPASEKQLLTTMDIGIMPLPDDEWTRGKCGFKGLQCMSYGIPVVMSAVGVNKQIVNHGMNGFLATTNSEWVECISKLIASQNLRNEMGNEGRKTVCNHYSKEVWQENLLNIFDTLTINK